MPDNQAEQQKADDEPKEAPQTTDHSPEAAQVGTSDGDGENG